MWKLVPQETKDMYEQKAQADKDRYADVRIFKRKQTFIYSK